MSQKHECTPIKVHQKEKGKNMPGRVKLKGQIGTQENMMPKAIKLESGKTLYTFKMWAEDYTKAPQVLDNGSKRFQRSPVQVILPDNERGKKLFKLLVGGRKIMVEGRLGFAPNIGTNKDGEQVAYPNPRVYFESLEFMDEPPMNAAERVLTTLQADCKVLSDDQKEQLVAAYQNHLTSTQKVVDDSEAAEQTLEDVEGDLPF